MDEISLICALSPRPVGPERSAREAARRELEASIERASAPATPHRRLATRRRLLSLAAVGALASVLAGIFVLNSGPTAQPAAAEALHETAVVATSTDAPPALIPGPGQYLYMKEKAVEFEGWYPNSYTVGESPTSRPGGFSAEIPKEREMWFSQGGDSRTRQVIGTPRFIDEAQRVRWEREGSFLPGPFDPRSPLVALVSQAPHTKVVEIGRGVVDTERRFPGNGAGQESDHEPNYPDLSAAPTDPKELRLAVQNRDLPGMSDRQGGAPLETMGTIEELAGLLHRPNASPVLRAAAFNALAELPGVELDREASDLIGRSGYAISVARGTYPVRDTYIIDPRNSSLLGERTVLTDAREPPWTGYDAGLVIRNIAYLESKIVDSTRETD